jgi:Prenyltransferase and squalene oxidase repeat
MIESAIERACEFLCRAQRRCGWWADFELAPGTSSVWVTGYIGSVLARAGDSDSLRAAQAGWAFLASWQSEGWGYNLLTPHDADSTGWALHLGRLLGAQDSEDFREGWAFLAQHCRQDGGVATYADSSEIRAFIGASEDHSFNGWCDSRVCVTAAIASQGHALVGTLDYLRRTQRPDGSWQSYWWCEDEYATALAGAALARADGPGDAKRVAWALDWAMSRINDSGRVPTRVRPRGSIFAGALVAELLTCARADSQADAACDLILRDLIERQAPEGGWEPSAGLRVTPPEIDDPDTTPHFEVGRKIEGGISLDQRGLFTTATALSALLAARRAAKRRGSPESTS